MRRRGKRKIRRLKLEETIRNKLYFLIRLLLWLTNIVAINQLPFPLLKFPERKIKSSETVSEQKPVQVTHYIGEVNRI